MMGLKSSVQDLAIFGRPPLFTDVRSTSNLVQPDVDRFFYYAKRSFDARWMTNNGPNVVELEQRLAENHGTKYCVAFCNGLWGLVLTLRAIALRDRTEIIMPSLTYRRMADIAAWLNLTPHFCDVSEGTKAMSVDSARDCINENTALILGVHPIVNLADIDGLTMLARDHRIPLVFDSVEAAYASHQGQMVGSFGEAECFSMHASKFLNGFEAGYTTTNNLELARVLQKMRAFGFAAQDLIEGLGLNAKLNEIHAAFALASLDGLNQQIERNKEIYYAFKQGLQEIEGLNLWEYSETETRTFKNIVVTLNEKWPLSRDLTLEILHAENMLARPYYSPPLHDRKTVYPTISGNLPVTNRIKGKSMLLPCGDFVSAADVDAMGQVLRVLQGSGESIQDLLTRRSVR